MRLTEDLSHLSERRLWDIVETGWSPTTREGEVIEIHHVGQVADGELWELAESSHDVSSLHPLGKVKGVGLTAAERATFDAWRNDYWRQRAMYELLQRATP